MRRMFARLLPEGLAGRFALLLTGALVAANLMALGLLSSERARLGAEARDGREIERIVGLVPALEAVDARLRRSIVRDAATRGARVSVDDRPIAARTQGPRAEALRDRLADALAPRRIAVEGPRGGRGPGARRARGPGGETIALSIALLAPPGGPGPRDWLNVTLRWDQPTGSMTRGGGFLLALGLSLAAVLGVGLVFVRHLTQPLTRLANAALAAGRGDRLARLPETGARELRAAARAFNDMQARITRFDAERMRTLAAVGHDLRTPITSLRIRVEMLEDAARDPMVRTLDEMTVMADGLVAFARGDGEVEETRSLELAALLGRVCDERGAGLELVGDPMVLGRPVALGRAIGNVIDNALRYGGGARVGLSVEEAQAVIRIADEGPGIPDAQLAQMFEPFVRGEQSRNAQTGGAGLGLSIARQIIGAHGGEIALVNRPRGGLEVTITLPLAG